MRESRSAECRHIAFDLVVKRHKALLLGGALREFKYAVITVG